MISSELSVVSVTRSGVVFPSSVLSVSKIVGKNSVVTLFTKVVGLVGKILGNEGLRN